MIGISEEGFVSQSLLNEVRFSTNGRVFSGVRPDTKSQSLLNEVRFSTKGYGKSSARKRMSQSLLNEVRFSTKVTKLIFRKNDRVAIPSK